MEVAQRIIRPKRSISDLVQQRFAWQLGIIAGSMGLMLIVSAIVALIALQQVLSATELRAQAQQQQEIAYKLQSDVQGYTIALLDMGWTDRDRRPDLDLFRQRFAQDLNEAKSAATTTEQSRLLQELGLQQDAYRYAAEQVVKFNLIGRNVSAATLWMTNEAQGQRTAELAQRYYDMQSERATQAQQLAYTRGRMATIAFLMSVIAALAIGTFLATLISRRVVRTLGELTHAAEHIAAGKLATVKVVARDELGTLATAFNVMANELAAQRDAQQRWSQELEHQVTERTAELQEALVQQQQLLETIRSMSTPVIPILDGVLVLPLVGVLDAERMQHAQTALLQGIERQRAHTVVLDITGIPIVDTHVAHHFIALAQQARLLGAQCLLVGMNPEVAQTIVSLGIDLRSLQTLSNLQTAITNALWTRARRPQMAT